MSERSKHLFEFRAEKIAAAAKAEAEYHLQRVSFWRKEYEAAVARLKESAKVEFREYDVTGGKRVDLAVDYGDMLAYQRMQEAWSKIESHRHSAEQYRMEATAYESQSGRVYTLDTMDVLHYRLNGGPREE